MIIIHMYNADLEKKQSPDICLLVEFVIVSTRRQHCIIFKTLHCSYIFHLETMTCLVLKRLTH